LNDQGRTDEGHIKVAQALGRKLVAGAEIGPSLKREKGSGDSASGDAVMRNFKRVICTKFSSIEIKGEQ